VIDGTRAQEVKAALVVEGANLPTSPDAQTVLAERGITVIPDFVANAGGVVAAAFAMDSRYSGFRPDTAAIFATISTRLRANTVTVLDEVRRRGTPRTPPAATWPRGVSAARCGAGDGSLRPDLRPRATANAAQTSAAGGGAVVPRTSREGAARSTSRGRDGSPIRSSRRWAARRPTSWLALSTVVSHRCRRRAR
jgi:hypothetical protein